MFDVSFDDSRPRNLKTKSKAIREWKEKYYNDELSNADLQNLARRINEIKADDAKIKQILEKYDNFPGKDLDFQQIKSSLENLSGMTPNEFNENMELKPSLPKSNLQHIAMNKLFIVAAFLGSILMVLGYSWGPDGCEDSTIFEAVGKILLFMSLFGIVINVLILLGSISKDDFDSAAVIGWGFLHALCWFVAAMIASDALLSDAWCNGNGPSYDIGAGF